jgi:hypothetical protein
MWLMAGESLPPTDSPLAMFIAAQNALVVTESAVPERYRTISLPEEHIDTTIKLDWFVGISRVGAVIADARQEAHLRVDRTGSEARVATVTLVASVSFMPNQIDILVDAPHIAFWTDADVPMLPLAVARFEKDSWTLWDHERAKSENGQRDTNRHGLAQ